MTTPQSQAQPPSQPVYQRDLSLILDRVHNKFVEYANAKDEALAVQMRIGFAESYNRDEALHHRIENVERRLENVESTQQIIIDTLQLLRQEVRAGFGALDEKINELTTRVVKLERGIPPTEPQS
ncbi:MAG: hypothetical protein H0U76_18895 [Ktedonobacteraceae bacterium]|nr:hypothetical protein [Ktedonobacteraceae bacterium]MBA3823680.1 hypothetical protein [Ktedonobacterales bacterium]